MKTALKKAKFVFVGLLFSMFIFATPAHAESWTAWLQTQFSLNTLIYSANCQLLGCGLQTQLVADASGNVTPKIVYNNKPGELGGLLGFTTNSMIALYENPPTSSTYYLANVGKEFGISPAYAQVSGSGAGLIKPVEQLWQIMRNLSYLFFIIIFVAIGFMIMLRQKLNAQTVITIQSALPGLVVGLILVTFSYFIAALITDAAFLGVQLVAQIFVSVVKLDGSIMNLFDPVDLAQKSNIFDLYTNSMSTATKPLGTYVDGTYWESIKSLSSTAAAGAPSVSPTSGILSAIIIGGLGWAGGTAGLVAGAGAAVAVAALPLIVTLVLLIAFTVQFLKLMFKLIMSYIMILLTTALGPAYITMSMLPGRGGMLGMWWKTILGNALVFPAVFALFLFAGMIMSTDQSAWSSTPPFFGNFSTKLIQPIIAFTIMLGSPAIPDMVKKAIGAADFGAIGSTGTAGFMAGFGIGSAGFKKGREKVMGPLDQQRAAYQKAYAESLINPRAAAPSYGPPGGGRGGLIDWAKRKYVTSLRT